MPLFRGVGARYAQAIAILLFLTLSAAFGVPTRTWDGAGFDNNFTTALNWSTNVAPSSGDNIQFAGTTRLTPTLNSAFTIGSMTFLSGAGAFTLGGAGTYTIGGGITNSSSNTQTINNALSFSTAQGFNASSGALVFGGNLAMGASLSITGSYDTTFSGVLSGIGTLTNAGTGTITLSGVNTYTGQTLINSGTISVNSLGNLSTASSLGAPTTAANGTIKIGGATSGGTLVYTGGTSSTNRTVDLSGTTGGATLDASGSGAITFSNPFTASGAGAKTLTLTGTNTSSNTISGAVVDNSSVNKTSLVKNGTGTWVLGGTNTYSGGSTINGGILSIGSAANLGATTGALTINAGTLDVTSTFSTARATALNNAASTIQVDPSQTFTVTSAITGTGALNKTGTGTLQLGGANTFGGGTFVSAGTLQITASERLANTGALSISGGTFDVQTFSETVGAVSMSSGSITGTLTGTLTGSSFAIQSGTVSAALAGTGGLAKSGSGTLTLSGANTYTGGTTISGGTVIANSASSLGATSSSLTLGAGTLEIATGYVAPRSVTITDAASTFQVDANQTYIVLGSFSGSGTLNKTGAGTMIVAGADSFTGGTNVAAGTLQLNASNLLPSSGSLTISGGTFNLQTFSQTVGAVSLTSGAITSGTLTGSSFTLQSGTASATLAGNAALTKLASGTVTLDGTNTYTGTTLVSAGVLQIVANGALGSTVAGTTVASGAELRLNNVNYSATETLILNGSGISNGGALVNVGTSTYAGSISAATDATINAGGGTLNLTGGLVKNGTTLTLTGGGQINISGIGISGSLLHSDLVVDGTSVMLSAASSYNGPTTIQNSGMLQLGANNVLPTSPQTALTINSSSALDMASYSDGIASLSGDSTGVVKNSVSGTTSTLTVNPAVGISTAFGGVISGTNSGAQGNMALVKSGAGTLVLNGANTFTGSTTVNGGTLTLAASSGSALASTSITVNSGGTLQLGASDQIANTAVLTLAGGTFAKGNYSEGSATSAGISLLSLASAASHLDFGTGTVGTLSFGSFNPNSQTLLIDNWTGTPGSGGSSGTTDRLIFATDESANLMYFQFNGYWGATEVSIGGGYFEVIPISSVPEPNTYLFGVLAIGGVALHTVVARRKRQLRDTAGADDSVS